MTTGSVLAQFTITLSQAVSEQVAVEWHTADGTALAGVDYAAAKGTVLFAPGQTAKTVDILVHGRAVGAEDRSFFVEMLPPTNAILGASIGECIIHVDTTGSTPVTQIIVPTGPQGLQGDSAYQAWLDLGNTGTEEDFINSLKPSAEEIAEKVAPILNVSNSPLTAEGTETLSKPDTMTGKRLARRVAYVGAAKVATVVLADGDNLITHAALSGDAVDFNSISLYPRILRGTVAISPEWSVEPGDKLLIKSAVAGDFLHVCQYDIISERAVRNAVEPLVVSLRDELAKRGGLELLCAKMWAGQTVTIGCYGDSTTDGNNTTGWAANPTSGGNAVGNSDHNLTAPNAWPAKLQEYLREIFKNNNIKTFNAGYSGQRMDNGWALNNYSAAMVNNPYYGIPNVCFIGFGLNDITAAGSQIDNHIDQTVKLMFRMVSEGTIPVILTCDAEFRNGQFGDARDHKEARRELDAAKRALGDKYGVLVVDIGDVLKQWIQNNNDGYKWPKEQNDALHFSNNGHSLKAQYLASQMFIDTVPFSGGEREVHQWSSEAAYVGNYATYFKLSNNSQGGNVYFPSAAPVDTDMMTVWVWNTCRNAYLVYQGIENEGITDAIAYTVAPKVEVKDLFGSIVTSKSIISPGFKNTSGYQRSDEQFIHSRLKYGLNKVTYRSGDSTALFYGSFKLVDAGNKLTYSNALKETGPLSKLFKKETGAQFMLPLRAAGLSNTAGGFASDKVSISFDVSCVKNTGVILLSGQGYTPSQAAVDNNQQVSLLMHRNSADGLVMYALQTDNTGAASFSLLGTLASGWTTDAKVGRVELYRSGNNQIIEVYDAFQGGNAVLTLTLPNTGITSRWSGYAGGLYAFTTGAASDQLASINRMVINR